MTIQQFNRSLPMMLYRALDAVMPRFRRIFAEFGLTEQQWRVLRVLWEHEEIALNELAELTVIRAPSLVGIVDRLTKLDLIARRRSDTDRRIVYVLATGAGRDIEHQIMPRVASAYADLKLSVDPQTWEALRNGLESVAAIEQPAPRRRKLVNE